MRKGKYVPGDFELLVKKSPTGKGLYAGEKIPRGACIIEYVGKTISKAEEYTSRSKYLFEVSSKKTIDGRPKWNKAGYINHSCKPNAEPVIHKSRIFIMAKRSILPGEEITYEYGDEYVDDHIKPFGCRCGKCDGKPVPKKPEKKGKKR